jgi:hypothetical protein
MSLGGEVGLRIVENAFRLGEVAGAGAAKSLEKSLSS